MAPPAQNFCLGVGGGGGRFYDYNFPPLSNSLTTNYPYTPNISPRTSPTSSVFLPPIFPQNPFTYQNQREWRQEYRMQPQHPPTYKRETRRREYTVPNSPPATDASLSDGSSGPSIEGEDELDGVEAPSRKKLKPWLPLTSENLMRLNYVETSKDESTKNEAHNNSNAKARRLSLRERGPTPNLPANTVQIGLNSSRYKLMNIKNITTLNENTEKRHTIASNSIPQYTVFVGKDVDNGRHFHEKTLPNFRVIVPKTTVQSTTPVTANSNAHFTNKYPNILNPILDHSSSNFEFSQPHIFYSTIVTPEKKYIPRKQRAMTRENQRSADGGPDFDYDDSSKSVLQPSTTLAHLRSAERTSVVDLTSDTEEYLKKAVAKTPVVKNIEKFTKAVTRSSTVPKDTSKSPTILRSSKRTSVEKNDEDYTPVKPSSKRRASMCFWKADTGKETKRVKKTPSAKAIVPVKRHPSDVLDLEKETTLRKRLKLEPLCINPSANVEDHIADEYKGKEDIKVASVTRKAEEGSVAPPKLKEKRKEVEPEPEVDYQPGERPPIQEKYLGLTNLKQTCYANSIVQALFCIPALRDKLLESEFAIRPGKKEAREYAQAGLTHRRPMSTRKMTSADLADLPNIANVEALDIWEALARLTRAMYYNDCAPQTKSTKRGPVCTENFFDVVATNLPDFRNHMLQQDVHEYLVGLLGKLESHPAAEGGQDNIILSTFQGSKFEKVVCNACGRSTSGRSVPFKDIWLPTPTVPKPLPKGVKKVPVTLDECLKATFRPYSVQWPGEDAGDQHCEFCKSSSGRTKYSTIEQCPEVLCLTVQHFDFELLPGKANEPPLGKTVKKPLDLDYPQDLNMASYLKQDEPEDEGVAASQADINYELFAVVFHNGKSSDSGHYYTNFKADDGQWYTANDDKVNKASPAKKKDTPYLLFYRRSPRS